MTTEKLRALAEQLEADARAVRQILADALNSDITPEQATSELRELGIFLANRK